MIQTFIDTEQLSAQKLALGLLAFVVITTFVRFLIDTYKAVTSPLSDVPGPWYAPYFNLHLMSGFATGKVWKYVEDAHAKYGPYVRLGPRQVWISDKEAMKQILLSIDLPKVMMYAEISRDRFSPGLFGEVRPIPHKKLRKLLHNAFTVSYVDGLDEFFREPAMALMRQYGERVSKQENGGKYAVVDLMDDVHKLALDIMGECSLGRGFGNTDPSKQPEPGVDPKVWQSIPRAIFESQSKRYMNVYIKRTLRYFGLNFNFDWSPEMVKAIDLVVKRRQADNSETKRQDLLQHLIDEGKRPDNDKQMTSRDILDQMSEIMLAGSETTSGTIACFCLEMARNPKVQAKLLESLPPMKPDDPILDGKTIREDPTFEYFNACVKENLRMHPIASEMGRKTGKEEVTLGDRTFPAHTIISASYRDLHHNSEFWPEAKRFWPERFLPEESAGDAPPADESAYYPFSAGKHTCIGQNFAWGEMRVVLANLFSRFELEEVPNQFIDFRQYITMQFHTGSWYVKLKPRA